MGYNRTDIIESPSPLALTSPPFPIYFECSTGTRLPHIVNVDFSRSSQHLCLPWAKPGSEAPTKRLQSRLRVAGGRAPLNCKILRSVLLQLESVVGIKKESVAFGINKLTIMFTIQKMSYSQGRRVIVVNKKSSCVRLLVWVSGGCGFFSTNLNWVKHLSQVLI